MEHTENAGTVEAPEPATGQEHARRAAEEAAAEALARAHVPPGMTVVDADRSAGRRIASAAQAAREEGDVVVADEEDRGSVKRVAAGRGDEDDVAVTTEWLLADEQQVNTRKLMVRLGGSDDNPVNGPWIIRAIDTNVIRSAEREAAGDNRAARRAGSGYDELKANLRVVAEGTVVPDLKQLARQKGLADPVILLRQRFQFRVGVITALAAEIMALSGFDQDDVRAAGES
jgi:hypothetical protein